METAHERSRKLGTHNPNAVSERYTCKGTCIMGTTLHRPSATFTSFIGKSARDVRRRAFVFIRSTELLSTFARWRPRHGLRSQHLKASACRFGKRRAPIVLLGQQHARPPASHQPLSWLGLRIKNCTWFSSCHGTVSQRSSYGQGGQDASCTLKSPI
jgi:hypothetical protein